MSLLVVAGGYGIMRGLLPATHALPPDVFTSVPYGAVQAFFEAGTVGALADWFAVTALFRHPFGLPIPHTNLLIRNRAALEANLASTVTGFLSPEAILSLVDPGALGGAVAEVVQAPETTDRVKQAVHAGMDQALTRLSQASPMIGMFLQGAMGGETVHALIQQVVDGIQERLAELLARDSTDAVLRAQIERMVRSAFERGLHQRLVDAIQSRIQTMPDAEIVAFVENRVGDDLQFIRLNGALVGGLAGLGLFLVSRLAG